MLKIRMMDLQDILAFSALALAVGYLVWKFFLRKRKKKDKGCGPDCGC